MSEKTADDAQQSVEDEASPRIPQRVVDAAEQLDRGESVSKSELLESLDVASESDE